MEQRNATGGFVAALKHAFAIPPDEALPGQEQALLERLADRVARRGLAAPAVFLLQSAKPLNFVGSQLLVFFRPLITMVFPPDQYDRVAELLSRRQCLEVLARMIEERELRRHAQGPERRATRHQSGTE